MKPTNSTKQSVKAAKTEKVMRLMFDSYMALIENSVGSKQFRNYFAMVDGRRTDVMKGGSLSCAFFVTSVLVIFNLIERMHGTVGSAESDLKKSGWKEIAKPKAGCVLVWEKKMPGDKNSHKHIGFYIGGGIAISNDSKKRYPVKHSWDFNGKRKIDKIFWSTKLQNNKSIGIL